MASHWTWVIGLLLGLTATFCATVNKVAWKLGHNLKEKGKKKRATFAFICGTVALAVNPILDMASLYYAPQTLFAAIAGTGTVFNLILAKCVLGEAPSRLDVAGAAAVCMGCGGRYTTPLYAMSTYTSNAPNMSSFWARFARRRYSNSGGRTHADRRHLR